MNAISNKGVAMNTMRKRLHRGERGQIMVLGVMGVLLVALMMLLTLNVGQATYEKIRIQQLSDSSAFSTATLQARSYNFFAYTNRANIAGLVAASSAHAYMSMASIVPEMFLSAMGNFIVMGIYEIGLCCACTYCSCVQHCIHASDDFQVAMDYHDAGEDLEDGLKDTSSYFIRAIKALDLHMSFIASQQLAMRAFVEYQTGLDNVAADLLGRYSAGSSHSLPVAAALNLPEYHSTFEDSSDKRKWVATEIANGSRWAKFVFSRHLGHLYGFVRPDTLYDLISDIPDAADGTSIPIYHAGESRTVKGGTGVPSKIKSSQRGPEGDAAAGHDYGAIFSQAHCGVMASTQEAQVGSDKDSGEHKCDHFGVFSGDCCDDEGDHEDAFKCLGTDSALLHNCFTLFAANEKPTEDFGQPVVYNVTKSDLRRTEGRGPKVAWEVTNSDSGKVAIDLRGTIGKKEVQLTDNPAVHGQGTALSKALVYYHYPVLADGWKEHPNFFNPYWKAKLQPFRGPTEVAKVLTLSGDIGKYGPILIGGLLGVPMP